MTKSHEFGTGGLEGLAQYLIQRSRGLRRRKRELLEGYAADAQRAAERICELERKVLAYRREEGNL